MITPVLNIIKLTSWELIDLMLYHLENKDISSAKVVQDEILKRTYEQ